MGLTWLALSSTSVVNRLVKITPPCVIQGIQVAPGVMLGKLSLELMDKVCSRLRGTWRWAWLLFWSS